MWSHSEKSAVCNLVVGPYQTPNQPEPWSWISQPRTVRKICLLYELPSLWYFVTAAWKDQDNEIKISYQGLVMCHLTRYVLRDASLSNFIVVRISVHLHKPRCAAYYAPRLYGTNVMGPVLYLPSVIDRNVVVWWMTLCVCAYLWVACTMPGIRVTFNE